VKLTALVHHPDNVCCRYRLEAFRPYLERAGHHLELRRLPRSWWSWVQIKHYLGPTDAVILQRQLLPGLKYALLRRAARRLIFDFDDAVFLRDSYSAKGIHSRRRDSRFAATVAEADAVIAGNAFLREEAARWIDRRRIRVIPTCVDPDRYPSAEHARAGQGVELVWIGSSSTLNGLKAIRPLLDDIGQHVAGVRLKLICDRFFTLAHLPVIPCRWSDATEAEELARADIGISWLPDDPWSRGKCGLKVLQYMAAGLPVVANPVGVQAEMVRHGENGFLATTPQEWCAAVRRLADDPDLRRCMGAAGRRQVEDEYSVETGASMWLAALDALRSGIARAG
jgi:glycosyltransferase involved in cell wall biosynthesis